MTDRDDWYLDEHALLRRAVPRAAHQRRQRRQGDRHQPHAADQEGRPLHGRPLGRQVPQDPQLPDASLPTRRRRGSARSARGSACSRASSATPSRPMSASAATAAATCPTAPPALRRRDGRARQRPALQLPRTPSFRLDGRRALVAGASSGIGLGCAVALAEQGARGDCLAARSAADARRGGGGDPGRGLRRHGAGARRRRRRGHRRRRSRRTGPSTSSSTAPASPATRPRSRPRPRTSTPSPDLNLRGAYFLTQAVAQGLVAAGRPGSLINISSARWAMSAASTARSTAPPSMRSRASPRRWRSSGAATASASTRSCPTFIRTPLDRGHLRRPGPARLARGEDQARPRRAGSRTSWAPSPSSPPTPRRLVTGTALLVDGGWTAD